MSKSKLSKKELRQLWATEPRPVNFDSSAAGSSFVKMLSTVDRNLIRELMDDQRFEPGDIIFRQGDVGDALYLIWAGRVAVVRGEFLEPDDVLIRYPGEVVGEMAILENKPRWGSLVALDSVRVLRIVQNNFQELLTAQPAISLNLLALLSARLRAAHDVSDSEERNDQQLLHQLSHLINENEELMTLQRVQQETGDLIIHDLRSPLNNMFSVLNMLELVLPEAVLNANRELLDIARLAHTRMQDLVDSLLDVSRLDNGDFTLDLGPTNLKNLINEVVKLATFAIDQHRIQFETNIEQDLSLQMVDEDRIRRVMTNLIDNAIKYSQQEGFVNIDVSVHDGFVEVCVADSGPGIPEADRERIFERFAQVQRSGMRQTRGFGLGLAFCRLAIEAHGGRIWVEAEDGKPGSRFIFIIPQREVA